MVNISKKIILDLSTIAKYHKKYDDTNQDDSNNNKEEIINQIKRQRNSEEDCLDFFGPQMKQDRESNIFIDNDKIDYNEALKKCRIIAVKIKDIIYSEKSDRSECVKYQEAVKSYKKLSESIDRDESKLLPNILVSIIEYRFKSKESNKKISKYEVSQDCIHSIFNALTNILLRIESCAGHLKSEFINKVKIIIESYAAVECASGLSTELLKIANISVGKSIAGDIVEKMNNIIDENITKLSLIHTNRKGEFQNDVKYMKNAINDLLANKKSLHNINYLNTLSEYGLFAIGDISDYRLRGNKQDSEYKITTKLKNYLKASGFEDADIEDHIKNFLDSSYDKEWLVSDYNNLEVKSFNADMFIDQAANSLNENVIKQQFVKSNINRFHHSLSKFVIDIVNQFINMPNTQLLLYLDCVPSKGHVKEAIDEIDSKLKLGITEDIHNKLYQFVLDENTYQLQKDKLYKLCYFLVLADLNIKGYLQEDTGNIFDKDMKVKSNGKKNILNIKELIVLTNDIYYDVGNQSPDMLDEYQKQISRIYFNKMKSETKQQDKISKILDIIFNTNKQDEISKKKAESLKIFAEISNIILNKSIINNDEVAPKEDNSYKNNALSYKNENKDEESSIGDSNNNELIEELHQEEEDEADSTDTNIDARVVNDNSLEETGNNNVTEVSSPRSNQELDSEDNIDSTESRNEDHNIEDEESSIGDSNSNELIEELHQEKENEADLTDTNIDARVVNDNSLQEAGNNNVTEVSSPRSNQAPIVNNITYNYYNNITNNITNNYYINDPETIKFIAETYQIKIKYVENMNINRRSYYQINDFLKQSDIFDSETSMQLNFLSAKMGEDEFNDFEKKIYEIYNDECGNYLDF